MLFPKVVEYFDARIAKLGQEHDYNWWRGGFSQIVDTDRWKNEFRNRRTLPDWQRVLEGQPYPQFTFERGDTVELMLAKFGGEFPITEEYEMFADGQFDLWPTLQEWIDQFALSSLRTLSRMHGELLIDAFAGTVFTDAIDGQPLCSTTHTGANGAIVVNRIANPFGVAGLRAAYDLRNQFMSDQNTPITLNYDTLIISDELEIDVDTVLNTLQLPGGNNNDRNFWYRRLTPMYVPWLRETVSPGFSQAWFLLDSSRTPFRTLIGEAPRVFKFPMADRTGQVVRGRMFVNSDWPTFMGIIGSTGGASI
jgi:hypothetical protein